jgi:hypothetical protein
MLGEAAMRVKYRRPLAAALAAGILAAAGPPRAARADDGWTQPSVDAPDEPSPPVERPSPEAPSAPSDVHFELAALGRYLTAPIRGGTTPFGAGFGGRAGVAFSGVYLGASVVSHLGGSDAGGVSDRALVYGLEGGYGFRLASSGRAALTLRPLVGIGVVSVTHTDPSLVQVDVVTSASGNTSSSRSSDTTGVNQFYVEPRLAAVFTSGIYLASVAGGVLMVPGIDYYGGASGSTTLFSYGLSLELGLRL